MEDEFTEMESEESGYVSGRTQGFEIGPINFIELVRGTYLTVPKMGDVTLRVFPPQYDAESGIFRSGRVTSTVIRDGYPDAFRNSMPLSLTDEALDELIQALNINTEGADREDLRYDVEVEAVQQGVPLPLDSFDVLLAPLVVSKAQSDTVRGYVEDLVGYWPNFL